VADTMLITSAKSATASGQSSINFKSQR